MRVLVCGDRHWSDKKYLYWILDFYLARDSITTIIEGDAPGADTMAGEWAKDRNIFLEIYPAHWDTLGKAAGPIRNQQMIDEGHPDLVIAFHNDIHHSKGTKDMITRAEKAHIKVILHAPDALIEQKDFGFDPL